MSQSPYYEEKSGSLGKWLVGLMLILVLLAALAFSFQKEILLFVQGVDNAIPAWLAEWISSLLS